MTNSYLLFKLPFLQTQGKFIPARSEDSFNNTVAGNSDEVYIYL